MKFNGDIIITDPCYIMKNEEDWQTCNYGENLEKLNINTFLTSEGGDCVGTAIVDLKTRAVLGEFCTDSCMVSVMDLAEVLAYHPDFMDELPEHCYTVIKNFHGNVKRMDIKNNEDQYWAFVGKGNLKFRTDVIE